MRNLLAASVALFPLSAYAQAYQGAVVDLQYQFYDEGSAYDISAVEGTLDALWQFGTFGVQAGLVLGKVVDSSSDLDFSQYNGLAVHLTGDVSDNLRLGVMAAANNGYDGVYLYAAEALYLSGPLRIEGRIGDSFDNGDEFSLAEVKGSYAVTGPISVRFGTHYSDYGDHGHYNTYTIGAGYQLSSGTEVYADIGRHKNDFGPGNGDATGNLLSLGVRLNLGGADKAFSYQPLN